MLKRIRLRLQDMKTISKLISGADEQANLLGDEESGAEHFVLSALNLSDGSAKRVFARVGVEPNAFKAAIKKQYSDALGAVGICADPTDFDPEPIESTNLFHHSKPSGEAVMKLLHSMKKKQGSTHTRCTCCRCGRWYGAWCGEQGIQSNWH